MGTKRLVDGQTLLMLVQLKLRIGKNVLREEVLPLESHSLRNLGLLIKTQTKTKTFGIYDHFAVF